MSVDWDKGLPLELLSIVASGRDELKAMREVSRSWKAGYEGSIAKVKVASHSPMLPPGDAFGFRFPAARCVDLSESLLARVYPMSEILQRLGSRITGLEVWKLFDEDMPLLRQLPLTRLRCEHAEFTDAGLGCLRGLLFEELVSLNCSKLTSAAFAHLRGMPLRRLSLAIWGRPLKDAAGALDPLAAMPLTDLCLSCLGVSDAALAPLQGLPLTRLRLGGSSVTDTGLAYLRGAPLEDLDLGGCPGLTPAGLAHLRGMPLRRLDLQSWGAYQPGDVIPDALPHLAAMPLTDLDLSFSSLTDAGLALLRGRPFTRLNLSDCGGLTAAGLAALEGMPLEVLNLTLCSFPLDEAMVHLRGLPLTDLDVGCCEGLTDAGMGHLRGMPLNNLVLEAEDEVTDAGMAALEGAPLTKLDLSSVHVTGYGLGALQGAPLTYLRLGGCRCVTGLELLHGLPITTLDLLFWPLGSDAVLHSLHGLLIAELSLCHCPWVTDAGLEYLVALPLTSLKLRSCTAVTDLGLEHLTKTTLLASLDITGCSNVTRAGVQTVVDTLPFISFCRYWA